MALEELPPPSSGVLLEVSFRRLLASCEQIIAGDDKGREDLRGWRSSPVFHHVSAVAAVLWARLPHPRSTQTPEQHQAPAMQYVDTLQEQLSDLESAAAARCAASAPPRRPAQRSVAVVDRRCACAHARTFHPLQDGPLFTAAIQGPRQGRH